MNKCLLLFSAILFAGLLTVSAQDQLYVNNEDGGYYLNPTTTTSTPILLDDINVPISYFGIYDSLSITKLTFGISRSERAQPVTVKFYYALVNDTSTIYDTRCSFPPVEIGSAELDTTVAGAFGVTNITIGDGVNPLFKMAKNNNALLSDYHTFFLGVSISKPVLRRYVFGQLIYSRGSGWGLTNASQSTYFDSAWAYEPVSKLGGNLTVFFSEGVIFPQIYNAEVFGNAFGTLPVSLLNFSAAVKNNAAELSWRTASEINNKGFDIERSIDGRNFTKIGFIAGAGNSNAIQQYQFTDINFKDIKAGTAYYRLKQLDLDGKSTLSQVLPLKLSGINRWSVYPNPVSDRSAVQLELEASGKVSIQIFDALGRLVSTINKGILTQGIQTIPLNLGGLGKGVYFVKLIVNDAVTGTQTITK